MKTSNAARRIEPCEIPEDGAGAAPNRPVAEPRPAATRPRPSFGRRTIQIREQGFAPFRVR